MEAHGDAPPSLARFDALVRGDGPAPTFEEFSARLRGELSPWRQTCYFDTSTPGLTSIANARFERIAAELGARIPEGLSRFLGERGAHGPETREVVLGIDAGGEAPRLKYYLVFRSPAGPTVQALRAALGAPELPATLHLGSVCILGLDFDASGLRDFKIYVRLDLRRLPHVIGNFIDFKALAVGCRYLVFQHCIPSGRRQIYFHASSASLLEDRLRLHPRTEGTRGSLSSLVERMNRRLAKGGRGILRPWIASFVYRQGALETTPTNVYFHFT